MSLVTALSGRRRPTTEDGASAGPRPRVVVYWNVAMLALPLLVLGAFGWQRRWISDDGLIFTRPARQVLAGHGPVFNLGERAESSTSTLWQWILVAGSWISGMEAAPFAVYFGLLCSVVGYGVALDATRRLRLPGFGDAFLVPVGVLVLIALPPVWDFATSGLETGLTTLWTACCWWLLVRMSTDARRRVAYVLAFLAGLGPTIRPDMGIASVGFLLAIAVIRRPRPLQVLGLLGAALAAPVGYEIFRMGYYGVLLPLPAVTKEASASDWSRGWGYVRDLVDPYQLWIPLLVVAAFVAVVLGSRLSGPGALRPNLKAIDREGWTRITVHAVPVLCGGAMLLYVVRVGGDFMHGRMLLPGLLMLLLPILVVPASKVAVPAATLLVGWALVCAITFRIPYDDVGPRGIADERGFYTNALEIENPVTADAYVKHYPGLSGPLVSAKKGNRHVVVYFSSGGTYEVPLRADLATRMATVSPQLGMNGAATPLDGTSVDILGLSYPLAAHVELTTRGRPGHEKEIDPAWIFAEFADPAAELPPGIDPIRVQAARYTLTCGTENRGKIKELQDSVREPMSWSRFTKNLTGSVSRTSFRFPNDPFAAAKKICGVDLPTSGPIPAGPVKR
ncbi:hypothetical protein [Embleya sp. NPDC005575]|uniref:hypothetical protein n=1 Tax=Embleya sp. NPDC005575 TaxID=3156892 RepID=UPI0033A9D00F